MQCSEHGFPHKPTAVAYDPLLSLLAVGTETGDVRMYVSQCHYQLVLLVCSECRCILSRCAEETCVIQDSVVESINQSINF